MGNGIKMIIFGLVLFLMLSAGCTKPRSGTQHEYTCQDGTVVSDLVACTEGDTAQPDEFLQTDISETVSRTVYVDAFSCVDEGSTKIRCYFILNSRKGESGSINFKIMDMEENEVYSLVGTFEGSDFIPYQYSFTGNDVGDALEWYIDVASIDTSFGGETAYLEITLSDGTELKAEDPSLYFQGNLPRYTDEEMEQIYENRYLDSAIIAGENLHIGDNMEFELVRYGYSALKDTWGSGSEEYLRFDLEVTNNDWEEHAFYTYGMALVDNLGNQYDTAYTYSEQEFDGGEIYPGVTKKGLVVFEDVDPSATSATLIFEYGYTASYKSAKHSISVDLPTSQ